MANDGRINIIITEGDATGIGSGGSHGAGRKPKLTPEEKQKRAFYDYLEHELFHTVKNTATQLINRGASTYGVRTGDYVTQMRLQNGVRLAQKSISVGIAAFGGFAATDSPIGAMIGASVGLLSWGLSETFNQIDYYRQIRIQNRNIDIIRQRAGLDINDGSRGGI